MPCSRAQASPSTLLALRHLGRFSFKALSTQQATHVYLTESYPFAECHGGTKSIAFLTYLLKGGPVRKTATNTDISTPITW